jgi:hypothetical protein
MNLHGIISFFEFNAANDGFWVCVVSGADVALFIMYRERPTKRSKRLKKI